MRKRPLLRVIPPDPPRIGPQWFALSTAVNVAFLVLLVWQGYQDDGQPSFEAIVDRSRPVLEPEYMIYFVERPTPQGGSGEDEVASAPVPESERPELLAAVPAVREQENVVAPPIEVPRSIPPIDSLILRPVVGARRPLRPAFADGRLWIPPELTPTDRAIIALHVAEIDSVFRERLIERIGQIPPDSFALAGAGSWVTEIGGKQWGIDQQWIYLGGVKIPTILLALLPLPQGNFDQSRAYADYERMRQEIISQSRRQADREDIKRYIKEMEERMRDERERQRLYVAIRDTTKIARDTIIP